MDGLSHTAAFSELVLPNSLKDQTSPTAAESLGNRLGYKYGFDVVPSTQRKLLDMCENLDETLRITAIEFEPIGSPWVNGTRYTHLSTPNQNSCYSQNFGDMQGPITASSQHAKGVNVLFADGHVRWMGQDIDVGIWRALATRNGAEILDSSR
jgi:prepilin-type processing-associated H-X9-DG protein